MVRTEGGGEKEALTALLTTQLRVTRARDDGDPRREYVAEATEICNAYASTIEQRLTAQLDHPLEHQLIYAEDTWHLLSCLLNCRAPIHLYVKDGCV